MFYNLIRPFQFKVTLVVRALSGEIFSVRRLVALLIYSLSAFIGQGLRGLGRLSRALEQAKLRANAVPNLSEA